MKIYYGGGNCRFEIDQPILGFHIEYKGVIEAESQLIDGWGVGHKNRKIVGFSTIGATQITNLFTYTGKFQIIRCLVVTENQELIPVIPKIEDSARVIDLLGEIDGLTTEVDNLDKTLTTGSVPNKSKLSGKGVIDLGIIKNRTLSKEKKQQILRGRYGI